MKIYRLETLERLPIGLDEAWDFFSDPGNLAVITPPEMQFQITSELPERMYAGLLLTYTVRPLRNIPVTWVTEITQMVEHRYFVDEQRAGPYKFWHHQHHFREGPDGVEMRDIVHYALPLDPLSRIVEALLVGPQLDHIFAFRAQALDEHFGRLD